MERTEVLRISSGANLSEYVHARSDRVSAVRVAEHHLPHQVADEPQTGGAYLYLQQRDNRKHKPQLSEGGEKAEARVLNRYLAAGAFPLCSHACVHVHRPRPVRVSRGIRLDPVVRCHRLHLSVAELPDESLSCLRVQTDKEADGHVLPLQLLHLHRLRRLPSQNPLNGLA